MPPLNDNENWQEQYGSYRDVVLSKLERNGLTGLRDCIEFDYTFTPNDSMISTVRSVVPYTG
ncbi:hypothetical protein JCM19038_3072 [Geomicrobium sp. JCM 19038]|nr:hypothetical protein JCM19038_3072 [Geomicrobium sp. JCM 19038]